MQSERVLMFKGHNNIVQSLVIWSYFEMKIVPLETTTFPPDLSLSFSYRQTTSKSQRIAFSKMLTCYVLDSHARKSLTFGPHWFLVAFLYTMSLAQYPISIIMRYWNKTINIWQVGSYGNDYLIILTKHCN